MVGVEISESAVRWAQANCKISGIHNARFVIGKAEAIFNGLKFQAEYTAMVIDPPRKGCDDEFLHQTLSFGPKRIIYVSCDPCTQARDAKLLIAGGYRVCKVQPFDLFPQTRHIESVLTLER